MSDLLWAGLCAGLLWDAKTSTQKQKIDLYLALTRAYEEKRACNSPRAKTLWAEKCYWKSTVISKNRFLSFVQSTGSKQIDRTQFLLARWTNSELHALFSSYALGSNKINYDQISVCAVCVCVYVRLTIFVVR